tara:strand:- start:318 stop:476 length:159 start_codon:yes stop_codon:yes gene_type:complete
MSGYNLSSGLIDVLEKIGIELFDLIVLSIATVDSVIKLLILERMSSVSVVSL